MEGYGADVAEVYSPPRACAEAKKLGLRAGWSLDLTTSDEQGVPWDFDKADRRKAALEKVLKDEPYLITGSPMCTHFSVMMNANWHKWTKEEIHHRMKRAISHLAFCCLIYKIQHQAGRYFLHEHPLNATSWRQQCVAKLLKLPGVIWTRAHMCAFGKTMKDANGCERYIKKATGFMTNSVCIGRRLNKVCPNMRNPQSHEHVIVEGQRTKGSAIYTERLCREIRRGIIEQREASQEGVSWVATLAAGGTEQER